MSKSRAALIHLWPTTLVLAAIAAVVLIAWYPSPFLSFNQSGKFAIWLILAAGVLGPVLSWLVYKKGKRGLVFDLWIIVLVQIAAITWGTYSLYQSRPYFMVYTVDRFDVLRKPEVDPASITDPRFLDKPVVGPILLYANMPKEHDSFQKLLQEIMFEGKPDLQYRPEYWSLYSERQQAVLQSSRPLADLQEARPASSNVIDQLVKNHGGDIDRLRFVPALPKSGHFAVILNADNGEILDTLIIDPWLN